MKMMKVFVHVFVVVRKERKGKEDFTRQIGTLVTRR